MGVVGVCVCVPQLCIRVLFCVVWHQHSTPVLRFSCARMQIRIGLCDQSHSTNADPIYLSPPQLNLHLPISSFRLRLICGRPSRVLFVTHRRILCDIKDHRIQVPQAALSICLCFVYFFSEYSVDRRIKYSLGKLCPRIARRFSPNKLCMLCVGGLLLEADGRLRHFGRRQIEHYYTLPP